MTKCDKAGKERRSLLITDANGSVPSTPTEAKPQSRTTSESQQVVAVETRHLFDSLTLVRGNGSFHVSAKCTSVREAGSRFPGVAFEGCGDIFFITSFVVGRSCVVETSVFVSGVVTRVDLRLPCIDSKLPPQRANRAQRPECASESRLLSPHRNRRTTWTRKTARSSGRQICHF